MSESENGREHLYSEIAEQENIIKHAEQDYNPEDDTWIEGDSGSGLRIEEQSVIDIDRAEKRLAELREQLANIDGAENNN